jgi:hypothetical protein
VLGACLCGVATTADADAPLPAAEVRERRLIREETPLWRQVLALPADAFLLVTWPLKHALFWAESVRLDRRIGDVVLYPVRRLRGKDDEP